MALVDLVMLESGQIGAPTRAALRELWRRAFGDRFSDDDAAHAYGGVHVLARDGDRLIGHASVVPRRIRFGDQRWRTIGYVEAVATDPDRQGQGVGRRMMQMLQTEISLRWRVALLSTGHAKGFYQRLGWERWRGVSYTRTAAGVVADGEHSGLMILRAESGDRPIAAGAAGRYGGPRRDVAES